MTQANKTRGEVAITEAGDGVVARFTMDALERLESKYGDKYIEEVMKRLSNGQVSCYRICVEVAVTPAEAVTRFPWNIALERVQAYLLDALCLTVNGRTFEEQRQHEDKLFAERLEEVKKNPQLAARLFSGESGVSDIAPASSQTNSAALPQ